MRKDETLDRAVIGKIHLAPERPVGTFIYHTHRQIVLEYKFNDRGVARLVRNERSDKIALRVGFGGLEGVAELAQTHIEDCAGEEDVEQVVLARKSPAAVGVILV